MIAFSSVDLPAPLRPRMQVAAQAPAANDSASSTMTRPSPAVVS
jgi:hypothetical protein